MGDRAGGENVSSRGKDHEIDERVFRVSISGQTRLPSYPLYRRLQKGRASQ